MPAQPQGNHCHPIPPFPANVTVQELPFTSSFNNHKRLTSSTAWMRFLSSASAFRRALKSFNLGRANSYHAKLSRVMTHSTRGDVTSILQPFGKNCVTPHRTRIGTTSQGAAPASRRDHLDPAHTMHMLTSRHNCCMNHLHLADHPRWRICSPHNGALLRR